MSAQKEFGGTNVHRARRRIAASVGGICLVVSMILGTSRAYATWAGSVTDVLNSSYETTGCHDTAFYFKTVYGWTRSCGGGHDITTTTYPLDTNIYVRGYQWTSAYIVAATSYPVWNASCTTQIGTEYRNAWQIDTPAGTAGVAFHHLSNYHYAVTTPYTSVSNGTHVGEIANWGQNVYFCFNGYGGASTLASTGPHSHTEAAEVGTNFSDAWGFGGSAPTYPYIGHSQP